MATSALKFVDQTKFPQLNNVSLKAAERALYNLARFIQMSGRQAIRPRKKPRGPGKTYNRGKGVLKRLLWVERDNAKGSAVIGYRGKNKIADLHELGGKNYAGDVYPSRSALEPALEKGIRDFTRKFPKDFERYFNM